LLDEHAPALAGQLWTPDDAVERNENVLAAGWPVLKRRIERKMPPPDFDTFGIGRNQCGRYAVFVPITVWGLVASTCGRAAAARCRARTDRFTPGAITPPI